MTLSNLIYYYYSVFYDTFADFVTILNTNFVSFAQPNKEFLIFSFAVGLFGDFPLSKCGSKGTENNKEDILKTRVTHLFQSLLNSIKKSPQNILHATELKYFKADKFPYTFLHGKTNFHSHVVIGCKKEVISLMELVRMGVKLLVTFQRIALMICSRPFPNITSEAQILIHFC